MTTAIRTAPGVLAGEGRVSFRDVRTDKAETPSARRLPGAELAALVSLYLDFDSPVCDSAT